MPYLECTLEKNIHGSQGKTKLSVDLTIDKSETAALFGPSGAGKTTILRMLAGLTKPDAGRIVVDGTVWYDSSSRNYCSPQNRHIGFVFQDYALFPTMTVVQNIAYGLRTNSNINMVDKLLTLFDLKPYKDRYPATLSGGQKQRTALARALVSNPQLLLLDEPLSALDPVLRAQLQETLTHIQRNFSLTTLLVSHDIAEIFRFAKKVYCIDNGRITQSNTPAGIFAPHADASNCLCIIGNVVSITHLGATTMLTLVNGSATTTIPCSTDSIADITTGDRVHVSVQAVNPHISKLAR